MGDQHEATGGGEQDDVSFLRTNDIVGLTCISSTKEGGMGTERVCLSAEGFGNRMCYLENVSDNNQPPDIAICMFYIQQALSVRALQEMMSASEQEKLKEPSSGPGLRNLVPSEKTDDLADDKAQQSPLGGGGSGHRTLLYGHAVQLRHVQSDMYLSCLSTSSSFDKLAFDVGLQESHEGEACWWTIHPASKQRSEGEKVRVGDDVILVSVATERYLHLSTQGMRAMVIASFHQTLWSISPISSGTVRLRNHGSVFGNDTVRFFHGQDECLTIPENWSEHPQHNMIIYEGGNAVHQARALWRLELVRAKWHGALIGWEQPFRARHVTTGRYLGITADRQVCLLHKDKADFESTAFIMLGAKDAKRQVVEEKEEEGMGAPTLKYSETIVYMQHLNSNLWMSYQTTEVTKKGIGKVEEKKAIAAEEGHMDDCFQFNRAQDEESKSARVIRKCSSVLNRFLKGLDGLQTEGSNSTLWTRVDLGEVLKLMEDLIEYFQLPAEDEEFEEKQKKLKNLRNRQDLFQEEGVLNMILDTIDQFSVMESQANFATLLGETNHEPWAKISTYLYLLVAAMIKANHSNCAQFASAQRLDWLFGRLANPQSAEGILDVLYCVLTESPEALNMITEDHIKSVISLLEKVGRDPKVLDVLCSLCSGNGVAVRRSQNLICNNLLPSRDLLLQTKMVDQKSSVQPNILVGVVEGSSMFHKWYFEAEVEHIEPMTSIAPFFRVGWGTTGSGIGFIPYPGSGHMWGAHAAGDDLCSWTFDGRCMWSDGKPKNVGTRDVQRGDVVGCFLDLTKPEITYSLNGNKMDGVFQNFNLDGYFFPVMSLSAKVSCRFILGGDQGKLRYGPPKGYSAIFEAAQEKIVVAPCFNFGDLQKCVYQGPSLLEAGLAFVPAPIDTTGVLLAPQVEALHEKLAENMHELWAMTKIQNGWIYGDKRSETKKTHPCLTTYDRLPHAEKNYNINLALDTLKTITALGYHMTLDKPPTRMKTMKLGSNFAMPNGYKPAPLDTREQELDDRLKDLGEALAKNTHNIWSKEKISRGWTYGFSEDPIMKRSPHLVPYDKVDTRIKQANRDTAGETIRTILAYGYLIDPPSVEVDEGHSKEVEALKQHIRTYRAEKTYAVTSGKWYFEFEVITSGFMRVGWMDIAASPSAALGVDEMSYGFDGYLVKKWFQGPEPYGKAWNVGDIIGCFLDLNDKTISFSLNGELLLDFSGAEMAFDGINVGDGFVPAFSLATGQRARMNFGQNSNSLKYFTTCGLQEGYEPFCVNMYRQLPLWYNKELAMFESIEGTSRLDVARVAPSESNPPCLRLQHKTFGTSERTSLEFLRLSLPVKCNSSFVRNKDREAIRIRLKQLNRDLTAERSGGTGGFEIKMPTIPREFGGLEGQAAEAPTQTLERRQAHRRSTFAKAQSLDIDEDVKVNNSLEPPTLRVSTSEFDLANQADQVSPAPTSATSGSGATGKRSRTPLKMLASFGQRVRDASSNKSKKEDKNVKRPKSVEPSGRTKPEGTGSFLTRSKSRPYVQPRMQPQSAQGPLELLEGTRSGPGRKPSGRVKRGGRTQPPQSPPEPQPGAPPADDDSWAMEQMIDQMDEYYYGVRIFPGQDPAHVWVGWVTPFYHTYSEHFAENVVKRVTYSERDSRGELVEHIEYRDCYMVNAQELISSASGDGGGGSKMTGFLIGCLVDISTGDVTFMANSKETQKKFKVEPNTMLYPAVFVEPTSKEILQFELGRIKYTLPLSAAIFKSMKKNLRGILPPRLTLQTLQPFHWARVSNKALRVNALKLSDVRGWSVLCDDPVRMLGLYLPEQDYCADILEAVERTQELKFHAQTLQLYVALCAQSNYTVAHYLCQHVNEEQLRYAIQNEYLSGPLRVGFHDLLIAIHLETHALARRNTSGEFIIPLISDLQGKNVFSEDSAGPFPCVLGPCVSIRPVMASQDVQVTITRDIEKNLKAPIFDYESLKSFMLETLASATHRAVMNSRDLIGGDNYTLFVPILRVVDQLLVIGLLTDDDIKIILLLLDPASFDQNYIAGTTQKGLVDVQLSEGVKLETCRILNHLLDIQLRHRVESLISFAEQYCSQLQADQVKRYIDIKQSDLPPAEAARKTKEFRCPPKEQMIRLLKCKKGGPEITLDEEGEVEECPMSESLQEQIATYHQQMIARISVPVTEEPTDEAQPVDMPRDEDGWLDKLAVFVVRVPPPVIRAFNDGATQGEQRFCRLVSVNIAKWSREVFIEDANLVREMFRLLLRSYSGVQELMSGLEKTYVIHERNIKDIEKFLIYLGKVRALLSVQTEQLEDEIIRHALWSLQNNNVFFQHPDLMRILSIHENIMTIMINILGRTAQAHEESESASEMGTAPSDTRDSSDMVVACCRFLCYFCRTSASNQKAMFEHLPFLLDNATMLLARPSLRGSVPLDVAYSSCMDNNELALALKESELDKVAVYLSRCGLQSNSELVAKGYPDIGWDPVEGERYLDFLRFCVWVNGESVEENANLVIRLLIRRPECLGPALKGEGEGLLAAFKQAITMSEQIAGSSEAHGGVYLGDGMAYPNAEDEGEDYIDMGGAVLGFYSTLVDLLAKCAPEAANIHAGKGESMRARAILRSLISVEDLEAILALRFTIPNAHAEEPNYDMPAGLSPQHKQSILMFLDRVYGVETQEMFFRLLESSFLPDLRATTMLDAPKARDCDVALALNRYLCNAVLPLLTIHSRFFANAEHHAPLLDAVLHSVYRMSKLPSLTNNQRVAVSEFLIAMTRLIEQHYREMTPPMMLRLLRQVVVDIPALTEFAIVPLRIMTLHYERCGKYYGQGNSFGTATEEEKRLTMILFSAIFDSLGKRAYDPELFGRALPCLTAIGSALSPDYTLTTGSGDEEAGRSGSGEGIWVPRPVEVANISLNQEMQNIVQKFAEHFHDSWASRKIEKGWNQGEIYSRINLTHPRLKPFSALKEYEKNYYKERCSECLRALLAWGYRTQLVDQEAARRAQPAQQGGNVYSPRPVDLSNMTLTKDMLIAAEKMADNAHGIWAKKTIEDLSAAGGGMLMMVVPWDLLTDFERRKYRFRSQEILKFLQYNGYQVTKSETQTKTMQQQQQDSERAGVEKRFAYSLLEKLLVYLDNAAFMMRPTKPSSNFSRRNSFRQSTQDVKFFGKVVLPVMQAYFRSHMNYFLIASGVSQAGIASNREKEMVASLFCRLAMFLRKKAHAFGCDAKVTVGVLQCLVQAMDCRTLVKMNSDLIRTSLLQFFHSSAEDLTAAVKDLREHGQYSAVRGANLKSWTSLEFADQVLLPLLTSFFAHVARNNFGADLIVDEIQVACYKILDSLYSITGLTAAVQSRKQIKDEFEKHRPALGQCLSAFARAFPVAFLESEFNMNNKYSVLAKLEESSVQAQDMLQNLSQNVPTLDKLLANVEALSTTGGNYADHPNVFDVDLPLVSSYVSYWWQFGPEGPLKTEKQLTRVISEHINKAFFSVLRLIRDHIGIENAAWLCRVSSFAQQLIAQVTADPVPELLLPISDKLKKQCEHAYKEEDRLRTHPDDSDEGAVAEENAMLVRDVYSFYPLLIKYTDLHRARWLKNPTLEIDGVYENVAVVFKLWSHSQHFKREELNFMSQFEEAEAGGGGEMKTGKAAIAERKKKRREGRGENKESKSIVVACLKRLLPVGLNVFGGRELDIVHTSKEKFLQQIIEDKVKEFIAATLAIPVKTDPTDRNTWQRTLYEKIGKTAMRGIDVMSGDEVVNKITNMGQVLSILHTFGPLPLWIAVRIRWPTYRLPLQYVTLSGKRVQVAETMHKSVSHQRKRLVTALITSLHLYKMATHRCINLFLKAYSDKWLSDENIGQDQLIVDLTANCEQDDGGTSPLIGVEEGEERIDATKSKRPDPLTQLMQVFQRAATSEQKGMIAITEDALLMDYENVMSKSIHVGEDDEEEGGDDEEAVKSPAEAEQEKNALREEQSRLADRGAAIMVLQYLAACNGEPSQMAANTLQLGIQLLSGGNVDIQTAMLNYLQEKKEVKFFTSMAGLMGRCSVLNLEIFERQIKAEGLGMGAELAIGDNQNLNDVDFTCSVFRFLQLTCEGHNNDFQNYLRNQPGNTTSVNLITASVDYLLRLQESVMDFYWHYSSKDIIDEGGKAYFLRALQVCSQLFNTLTEVIQGPCQGNQLTLAHSRLWDAINGFFFLFAQMMDKLSKNSSQLELMREFLNLQKDMIVLMLSMLEGNVLNGQIGKQMVETLVESQSSCETILKFFDMFLKLRDLTTSTAFQEFDLNKDGWISQKEFLRAMEGQKMYSIEEINYLMMCTDVNNDGRIDYMEFTERFHNPAKDIGFNLAVLLTNLAEHTTSDPRLNNILEKAKSVLDYFEPSLGRIEITGSAKRVEKVYFEIKEEWTEQWQMPQIKQSKKDFLYSIIGEGGDDKSRLEGFINFCEDSIFEMEHAQRISADSSDSRIQRAKQLRDTFMGGAHADGDHSTMSAGDIASAGWRGMRKGTSSVIGFLRPSQMRANRDYLVQKIREKTYGELLITSAKISYRSVAAVCWLIMMVIWTLARFIYYLFKGREDEEDALPALPMAGSMHQRQLTRESTKHSEFFIPPEMTTSVGPSPFEAFGLGGLNLPDAPLASSANNLQPPHRTPQPTPQPSVDVHGADVPLLAPVSPDPTEPPTSEILSPLSKSPSKAASIIFDTASATGGVPAGLPLSPAPSEGQQEQVYEPKIAETASKSKGSFWYAFARNFFLLKKICWLLTGLINLILLFYRVDITELSGEDADGGVGESDDGGESDEPNVQENVVLPEDWTILYTARTLLAVTHCIMAFAMVSISSYLSVLTNILAVICRVVIAYYQLKVPLLIFKSEKRVARDLSEGKWIVNTEPEEGDTFIGTCTLRMQSRWDRVVISAQSFPQLFWDTFVRKKARDKYLDQSDEASLNKLLALDVPMAADKVGGWDLRYSTWKTGIIMSDRSFLYWIGYCVMSFFGIFYPFFFAAHLVDVVVSHPVLQTILKAVTHNINQLLLTMLLMLTTVYIYSVLAFNIFRKFYVQEEDDEVDRKCHDMFTCLVYHFYTGVRSGGGIGDELDAPFGDDLQYPRMLFDMTFFFFVIVILLAIMQGLIIDAFGELRDQLEGVKDNLENNCFICGLSKEYFDKYPRGFEKHCEKEHNLANYLFFLMHIINKDETEYTGQETYVNNMYQERVFEFFPMGEAFVKQYEEDLMSAL